MSDSDNAELQRQRVFLLDVQARLQEVEDLLMSMKWEEIAVETANGSFQWRLGVTEEPPKRGKTARRC